MVNPSKNMHQFKANKRMRNKGQLVNIHRYSTYLRYTTGVCGHGTEFAGVASP